MSNELRRWIRLVENMQRHDTDPAMKAWLANSVVKHPVFHGTTKPFHGDQFHPAVEAERTNATRRGMGLIFFTDEPEVASDFAGSPPAWVSDHDAPERLQAGGTVYPCYIRLTNPYDPSDGGRTGWDEIEKPEVITRMKRAGHDGFISCELGGTTYCVFSPEQVRFAFGS